MIRVTIEMPSREIVIDTRDTELSINIIDTDRRANQNTNLGEGR